MCNTKYWKCFDLREKIVDFYRDYFSLLSESKYRAKYRRVLKILTTKQIFQRLRITFAQVKVSNTSESLLNEIRQIINSLYWEKEVTKKCNEFS